MNISAPFIHRPVATTLLTIAIAIAGGIAFQVLPVSPLPQVDFPTISVNASLPGASAEIMASSVATPLERQFGHIAGVSEMTSASSLSTTSVTIQFDLSRNIDGAARDVEAAINSARTYLPANLPANPTYRKVNPADAPIMILGLTSDKYGPDKLYDEASTVMQQKLSQIQGVGQVNPGGGALPSVRVEVNPTKLAGYGMAMSQVQAVLSLQNSNLARGQITDGNVSADIVVNGQISHAEQYKPLIIGYNKGSAVRPSDVADVIDSVQNVRAAGYLNGKRAVTLIIFRQPGANIIDTVDRIRAQLPSLEASIPQGIDVTIVLDRTTTIRASVHDVERTLMISIALVILVVFVFLRNGRATLIPAVAVPVSLIGTFAVMYLFGYSIDNLSLMALTISTGFVVDDAIVVMENITRHLESGMDSFEAALKGAKEIGFTVISISISLIAVFIPLLLMGGIVGRLFREFAVTLSTAILVSMCISLTTTPMMCAYLLKNEHEKKHGRLYMVTDRFFESMLRGYRNSLHWVLDNSGLTLVVLFLTIALNIAIAIKIPKGFFPQQDTGALAGGVQGPQDSSFPAMNDSIQRIESVVQKDPAVQNVISFTGGNGATNTGNLYISLKPLSERKIGAPEIINRIRPQFNRLPVASAFLQASQDLRIGGRSSNALYQYTIQADNVSDLQTWGPKLFAEMKRLPGLQDVNSDQQNGGLDEMLTYDRVTAAKLGQTAQSLDSGLYAAFGQSEVSLIYTQLNQYYVILEVAPQYWASPQGLKDVYFHDANSSSTNITTGTSSTGNTGTVTVTGQQSTIESLPLDVSWEPDLWGKVRNTIREQQYAAQMSAADLENERLTEQASLAAFYFEIRGQDALQDLYDRTVDADQKALDLTQSLYDSGIDDQISVVEARNTLQNAQSTAINLGVARAQFEHAIAVLIGTNPSSFSIPVKPLNAIPPPIPVGLPSQLLERRPDIAASERNMASANAQIGVAEAAFYPNLTLSAQGGFEASALSTLFNWPSRFWSIGATASETIFDAGLRRATVNQFIATYNADVANYRQTVLTAFQQVEDSLASVRILSQQIKQQQLAEQSAEQFVDLEMKRYQNGIDPYINVVTAQTTLLSDQQTLATLHTQEMMASVQLIEALGGGWDASQLPTPAQVSKRLTKSETTIQK